MRFRNVFTLILAVSFSGPVLAVEQVLSWTGDTLTEANSIAPVQGLTAEQFPPFLERQGVKVHIFDAASSDREKQIAELLGDTANRLSGAGYTFQMKAIFLPSDLYKTELKKAIPVKYHGKDLLIIRKGMPREIFIHEWMHIVLSRQKNKKNPWSEKGWSKVRFFVEAETALKKEFAAVKAANKPGLDKSKVAALGYHHLNLVLDQLETELSIIQLQQGEELDIFRYQFENRKKLGEGAFSADFVQTAKNYYDGTYDKFKRNYQEFSSQCNFLASMMGQKDPGFERCQKVLEDYKYIASLFQNYSSLKWDL